MLSQRKKCRERKKVPLVGVFFFCGHSTAKKNTCSTRLTETNQSQSSRPDETTRVTRSTDSKSGPLFARSVSTVLVKIKHGQFYRTSILVRHSPYPRFRTKKAHCYLGPRSSARCRNVFRISEDQEKKRLY